MKLSVVDTERCVGCQSCMFACSRLMGKAGLSRTCIGVRSAGGMERGFVVIVCRACEDPPCAKVCPSGALKAKRGKGVRVDLTKCIGCGNCQNACTIGAIFWDDEGTRIAAGWYGMTKQQLNQVIQEVREILHKGD